VASIAATIGCAEAEPAPRHISLVHHSVGLLRVEPERLTGRRLSADRLTDLQRAKITSAAVELFALKGFREATVAEIIARARVSRTCFYELFGDSGACLHSILAAVSDAIAHELAAPAIAALPARDRAHASLVQILSVLDAEPGLARVCLVEALRGDREVLLLRAALVWRLASALEHCLGGAGGREAAPSLRAEMALESVLAILHGRLLDPEPLPLAPLAEDLAVILLMPFPSEDVHRPAGRLAGPPSRRLETLRARRPSAASATGGGPSTGRRLARPPGT